MIGYLRGKLVRSSSQYIIVETGGVGYRVFVAEKVMDKVSKSKDIELHIHHYQTDKSEDLYGFIDLASLSIFESLIGVSGVGPKAAIALLSALTAQELEEAITKGDSETLTVAPGIGQKGAQKIIADLSDNLADEGIDGLPKSSPRRQAYEALLELGYNSVEAKTALRMVDDSISDPEEKIKEALKHLA